MANVKDAIIKVKLNGTIQDVMAKTNVQNVMYDDSTTLAAKLAEVLSDIGTRAKSTDVTAAIDTAINGLIDGAPDTYNTLKEIADYITAHEEVKDALQASIGNKLDKSDFTTFCNSISKLGALAGKDKVGASDLETTLKQQIEDASKGTHSHTNKSALDEITSSKVSNWDDAASKAHEHNNKSVLEGITQLKVDEWNGKSSIYVQASEPTGMKEGDLWIKISE